MILISPCSNVLLPNSFSSKDATRRHEGEPWSYTGQCRAVMNLQNPTSSQCFQMPSNIETYRHILTPRWKLWGPSQGSRAFAADTCRTWRSSNWVVVPSNNLKRTATHSRESAISPQSNMENCHHCHAGGWGFCCAACPSDTTFLMSPCSSCHPQLQGELLTCNETTSYLQKYVKFTRCA